MILTPDIQKLLDWQHLSEGSKRQRKAYAALKALGIFELFSQEKPIVAGTIPIGIDLEDSDLDVILHVLDFEVYREKVMNHFGEMEQFNIHETEIRDRKVVLANFRSGQEQIQLFADQLPAIEQYAVRHMIQEHRLLLAGGKALRERVLELKRSGLKTEPAFAEALGWKGDPYEKMLEMEELYEYQVGNHVLNAIHGIDIRPIRPEDDPALGEVIRSSFRDYGGTQEGTVFSDPVIDQLSVSFGMERSAYFVAEQNGEILGGAGIQPLKNAHKSVCELQKMYITRQARGKRLGKALMEYCLDFARKTNYTICYLESLPEFRDAIKLYEQSGFEYIPERMGDTGYYGCTLFLTKKLK